MIKDLITKVRSLLSEDIEPEVTNEEIIYALGLHKNNIQDAVDLIANFQNMETGR